MTAGPDNLTLRRVAVPAVLFLGAHLLAPILPAAAWGVDGVAYLWWLALPILCAAAVTLLPSAQAAIGHRLRSVFTRVVDGGISVRMWVAAGFVALTVLFPSATRLLGDGQLHVRELDGGVWDSHPRMNRAPLTFWLLHALHNLVGTDVDAGEVYAWVSRLAGAAFILLAVPAARRFSDDARSQWVLVLLLVSQGYVQLFFGYVENYPILFPLTLAYLTLCEKVRAGTLPSVVPAALLGVMVPMHFVSLAMAPAVVWAAVSRPSASLEARAASLVGTAALPVTMVLAMIAIGLPPDGLLRAETSSHALPAAGQLLKHQPHFLLSPSHLLQVANQYALVAPAVLLSLGLSLAAFRSGLGTDLTLLAAGAPLALFTLTFNPAIGAFRDWDAFALPAIPLTLLAARWLVRVYEYDRLARAVAVVAVASIAHTASWVAVNANAAASERRFERLIGEAGISRLARAYGAESIAARYRETGRLDDALRAFEAAVAYDPDNGRYHVGRAYVLSLTGNTAEAERALQAALETNPDRIDALINLGKLYLDAGRVAEARKVLARAVALNAENTHALQALGLVAYRTGDHANAILLYGRAAELAPGEAGHHADYGTALMAVGRTSEAEKAFRTALRLDPQSVRARMNLGAIYHARGDHAAAVSAFTGVVALDPEHADAHVNLGLALEALGRYDEAVEHLQQALELAPDDPESGAIRESILRIRGK